VKNVSLCHVAYPTITSKFALEVTPPPIVCLAASPTTPSASVLGKTNWSYVIMREKNDVVTYGWGRLLSYAFSSPWLFCCKLLISQKKINSLFAIIFRCRQAIRLCACAKWNHYAVVIYVFICLIQGFPTFPWPCAPSAFRQMSMFH